MILVSHIMPRSRNYSVLSKKIYKNAIARPAALMGARIGVSLGVI